MKSQHDVSMRPKAWLQPPRHSRISFDATELGYLSDNIEANGLMNPIEALPDGEIIAGHRRWKAAMLNDRITELPVRIITSDLSAMAIRIRRISENLQRSDLGFYDKYLECRGFRDDQPGITGKEIASALNVDPSTIPRYLCLDHCTEAVRQAAMEGRIGMKDCYDISKEPAERQVLLLAEFLAGGARQLAKARKRPGGTVPAVRVSRVKLARPSGHVVTIAGQDMSLDEAADELSALAAEMRRADKQGLSIKTFVANCRDQSAVGA